MKKTIVYFDDNPDDLKKYSDLLHTKLKASIVGCRPPPDLTFRGLPREIDLIVVDYELTQAPHGDVPASYQGGTLASRLSELYRETPIVILSRHSIFRKLKVTPDLLVAIDDWYFKDEFVTNPEVGARLTAIINGFSMLRQTRTRTFVSLLKLLNAESSEADIIKEAKPLMRFLADSSLGWEVHQIAKWIRRVLMAYPGILYDEMYSATSLGISIESFRAGEVQEAFASSKYRGVFSGEAQRWWRGRMNRIAQEYIRKSGLEGPIYKTFVEAFKKVKGIELNPSICVFSHEQYADTVCYVLKKPVKREFTLEYLPDDRPSVMEPARVSFKAIRESNEFNEDLLPDGSRPLLKQITKQMRT